MEKFNYSVEAKFVRDLIYKAIKIESTYENLKSKSFYDAGVFNLEQKQELVTDFILSTINLFEETYDVRGLFANSRFAEVVELNKKYTLSNETIFMRDCIEADKAYLSLLSDALSIDASNSTISKHVLKHYSKFSYTFNQANVVPQLVG